MSIFGSQQFKGIFVSKPHNPHRTQYEYESLALQKSFWKHFLPETEELYQWSSRIELWVSRDFLLGLKWQSLASQDGIILYAHASTFIYTYNFPVTHV